LQIVLFDDFATLLGGPTVTLGVETVFAYESRFPDPTK
jgi:hypothetical protein